MITVKKLSDRAFVDRLLEERFSKELAPVVAERFRRIIPHLSGDGDERAILIWIPGRIEVLGKHTDYAGGVSMTCASSRGIAAVALERREENVLSLEDIAGDLKCRIPFRSRERAPYRRWERYPAAVLRRLNRHFGIPGTGIHVNFESDLPRASGMSSSSSLVVMTYLAIAALKDLKGNKNFSDHIRTPSDLAAFLGAIESGAPFGDLSGDQGVGTRGGSEDHTAILFSEPGTFSVFGYDPVLRLASVPVPEGLTFVIATSGVKASKTGSARKKFNSASDLSRRITTAWSGERGRDYPTLGHIIEDPELDAPRLMEVLDEIATDPYDRERLWQRFAQFHDECVNIIPAALEALEAGDLPAFGELVDRSQELAGDWLHNQIPETAFLAAAARKLGAVAASSFGAGYGGAVWALVSTKNAREFTNGWIAAFSSEYPDRLASSHFFSDFASSGAQVIGADPAGLLLDPIPERASSVTAG